MQVLIASNDEQAAGRVRKQLTLHGLPCPLGHIVPLESAADRAARLGPELLVFVLPPDANSGLAALGDARNAVRNASVLVVGPTTDAQLILRTLHGGADEYLDENQIDRQLGATLVRMKAKRASFPEARKTGKVIAVLSPSGGCGSSTMAVNISAVLAREHKECGLIDLRLAAGDLASMLSLKPTHTIADLCEHLARVDRSMFNQFFVRHSSGIHLLAAPADFADIHLVDGKGVGRTLSMARERFPYVVVDLDNAFRAEQVEALWQSDVILLVLRPDYTSLRNVRRAMANFSRLGLDSNRLRVVVNRDGQRRQLSASQTEEALGMKPLHCIPDDPARANRAVNQGIPLVLQHPHTKIARSIKNLAMSVNGR